MFQRHLPTAWILFTKFGAFLSVFFFLSRDQFFVIVTKIWSWWQKIGRDDNWNCHRDQNLVTIGIVAWPNFCHDDKKLVTWQKIKKQKERPLKSIRVLDWEKYILESVPCYSFKWITAIFMITVWYLSYETYCNICPHTSCTFCNNFTLIGQVIYEIITKTWNWAHLKSEKKKEGGVDLIKEIAYNWLRGCQLQASNNLTWFHHLFCFKSHCTKQKCEDFFQVDIIII